VFATLQPVKDGWRVADLIGERSASPGKWFILTVARRPSRRHIEHARSGIYRADGGDDIGCRPGDRRDPPGVPGYRKGFQHFRPDRGPACGHVGLCRDHDRSVDLRAHRRPHRAQAGLRHRDGDLSGGDPDQPDHNDLLLAGRFLQGFGAASFRIVAMAIIRDQYEGAEMARITSFAMSIFVTVPCIAPLLGQGILIWFDWPVIFVLQFAVGIGLFAWFWLRQRETLPEAGRSSLARVSVLAAFRETLTTPVTVFYMIAAGLMFGSFMGYLISSHHLFAQIYGVGNQFALYFAGLSIVMGVASFTNGKIVRRLGPHRLVQIGLGVALVASGAAQVFIAVADMNLTTFVIFMAAVLSCMGFVFGNMNAIAVQPLGHIAGAATSMISFVSGVIAVGVGTLIGSQLNTVSPLPIFVGFFVTSLLALGIIVATKRTVALNVP